MSRPILSVAVLHGANTLDELKEALVKYASDVADVMRDVPEFERKTLSFQTQDLPVLVDTALEQPYGGVVTSFYEREDEGASYNLGALNVRLADDEQGGLLLGAVDTALSGLSANTTYVAELLLVGERE